MAIICDSREERNKKKASEKQYIYNSLSEKCTEVSQQQLSIGDYLLDGGFVVERKDEDLVSSITTKRIFEQINALCDYEHPILAITIKNLYKSFYFCNSRWIHSSYMGLLTTLMVSYPKLKLVFLDDTEEFVRFIVSLDKKIHDEGKSERSKILIRKPKSLGETQENVISGIGGVGIGTAKTILKSKGSIKNIANATKEELMEIPNIGEKTANEIVKVMSEAYEI